MTSLKGFNTRRKYDAELMYEMRRQDMTNKQIADQLGIAVSTVYSAIGRKSEAVKHAEVQNKPPVVHTPPQELAKTDEKPAFRPLSMRVAEEKASAEESPILSLLSAKYTMRGSLCQYIIDTKDGSVELTEGIVTGLLDKVTIRRFMDELAQVEKMMEKGDMKHGS